jgi:hypothetical protein
MSPGLGVLIMLNNYFHDVATALLLASGVAMWVVLRRYEGRSTEEAAYFLRLHGSITRLAKFSLAWILIGGVPRTLAYRSFEWAEAVGHAQVPALIVKHILAFAFVGGGAWLWLRLSKRVRAIRAELGQ